MQEYSLEAPSPLPATSHDGRNICIITLACGHKLLGPNNTILCCHAILPKFIHVDIPPAFSHLSVLPAFDDLPTYNTKTSANLDFLHLLKIEFVFLTLPPTSSAAIFNLSLNLLH